MIFAFDVYYNGNIAQAVVIGFEQWTDLVPKFSAKELIINIEQYTPGEFYKRELPCILRVYNKIDPTTISQIIVDGYVQLDDNGKPGLGAHLYEALDKKFPVIGIAKKPFGENGKFVRQVYRGQSQQPLLVTAIGVDVDEAAENVRQMHGEHRIPSLLKQLDTLSRR
jgi:deoxyribonuclease V